MKWQPIFKPSPTFMACLEIKHFQFWPVVKHFHLIWAFYFWLVWKWNICNLARVVKHFHLTLWPPAVSNCRACQMNLQQLRILSKYFCEAYKTFLLVKWIYSSCKYFANNSCQTKKTFFACQMNLQQLQILSKYFLSNK